MKNPVFDVSALTKAFDDADINQKHLKYVVRNVLKQLYTKGSASFDDIDNIPHVARDLLNEQFKPLTSQLKSSKTSADGSTTKLLIELQNGQLVETVIMRYGEHELRSFPEKEMKKLRSRWESLQDDGASINTFDTATARMFRCNSRSSVCVSSQVGCSMGCKFCATGTMGIQGNLNSGEILEQLVHANMILKQPAKGVVFMGQGEPLDNYNNVKDAVNAMCDVQMFVMSPMRISVSTVGVIPKLRRMIEDMPQVSLALSLHAPNQELRKEIVPTAVHWHIDEILAAAYDFIFKQNVILNDKAHTENSVRIQKQLNRNKEVLMSGQRTKVKHNRRKLMLEYVLLGPDVNCSADIAHQLGALLTKAPAGYDQEDTPEELKIVNNVHLNLIPYNPTIAGVAHCYEPPSQDVIDSFAEIVRQYGLAVTVRQELGQDINAACGQLVIEQQDIEDVGKKSRKAKVVSLKVGQTKKVKSQSRSIQILLSVALIIVIARLALRLMADFK